MNTLSLPQRWAACVTVLKDRINNRTAWEALEATHAITIENNTLIIGLDAAISNRAGSLQQGSNWNIILQTVQEVFKSPIQVRFIEGVTPGDWEAAKERDAHVSAMRRAEASRPVASEPSVLSWETVSEQINRVYTQVPYRSLPQGKARYVNETLYILVEAMDMLYPPESEIDESAERNLARILERVANNAEMPATVLAYELERLRVWRKTETGQ